MKRSTFCLGTLGSLLALTGCGGGAPTAMTRRGNAVLQIAWPDRSASSRLIPLAANSIRVVITDTDGATWADQVVVRPTGSSTSTVRFPELPVGELQVMASAFAETTGAGSALAIGSGTLTVGAGVEATLGLTLNSTITSVSVTYTPTVLMVGQTATLSLSAKDASGNIILTSPSKWQFVSSLPSVAAITNTTGLKGITNGTTLVTGTELESGVSGQRTISVIPSTPYYTIPLRPLAGYSSVMAFCVNQKGWIAGQLIIDHEHRVCFLWKPNADWSGGTYTLLDPLPGYNQMQPRHLSDSGAILLDASNTTPFRSKQVIWEAGAYRDLPSPFQFAEFLGFDGSLLGYDTNFAGSWLKPDGSVVDFSSLNVSLASVHPSGYVTGFASGGTVSLWRYKDGTSTYAAPADPYTDGRGVAVNASGLVCGTLNDFTNFIFEVGYWSSGAKMTKLAIPSGSTRPVVNGVSDDGAIVGYVDGGTGLRAVIWRNFTPSYMDFLVQAGSPYLGSLDKVAPNGMIVANGNLNSTFVGVLIVPANLL